MLDPAIQANVLRLHYAEHLSLRAIAAKLSIHRESVRAIIHRKRVVVDRASGKKRSVLLDPHLAQIDTLLLEDPARSATNILQKLRPSGYRGGVTTLRNYLRAIRPETQKPKAYLTLEFLPAQAGQVDWGDFGDAFGLGRKVWCFVMVLSWSRMLYIEFTLSANFESFIRCHEHAFRFFGGTPQEIWYDNCAVAVAEHRKKLVRFNPRFSIYTGHHNFKPVACNKAAGWEKGRVEDGVKFVRFNFWPGRTFRDMDDLNGQAFGWRDQFANRRCHRTTRKIPELMFAEEEKPKLKALREPFDTDEVRSAKVSHLFRLSFDGCQYSVPWRLAGYMLTVRANEKDVAMYYRKRCITRHVRSWERGNVIVNPKHEEGLRALKPGAREDGILTAIKSIGPYASRYLTFLPAQSHSIRAELKHLIVLITVYGSQAVECVIARALRDGIIGAVHVERLLEQAEHNEKQPPPLRLGDPRLEVPQTRPDLKSYDGLLLEAEPHEAEEDPPHG